MPISKPIEAIQKELQELLVDDIAVALKTLKDILSPETETCATVVGLLARLNAANTERLRDTLSNDELNTEYNKIRAAFLEIVQVLKVDDLESEDDAEPGAEGEAAPKQGSILYRIPGKMPKDKETKCVVRIAQDKDAIAEDITIDANVQLKELDRVSDTMQVELLDRSGGDKFKITTVNKSIQIIDETGFTEWWFYVTPLLEGEHPLILKVCIIETIDGQPEQKEIIMEETIEVVSEGDVMEADTVKPKQAGVLNFQNTAKAGLGLVTAVKKAKKAQNAQAANTATSAAKSVATKLSILQKVAVGLAVAGAAAVATWVLTPESTRDWWTTRYVEDTVAGYTAYMNEYPTSRYYEPAGCRRAILLDSPKAYRDYLIEFPDGDCEETAKQALTRLEKAALDSIEKDPSKSAMDAFLINFPACEHLEALYKIVEKDAALQAEYLPVIMQRWEECKRQDPAFPQPPNLVNAGLPSLDPTPPVDSPTVAQSLPVAPVETPASVGQTRPSATTPTPNPVAPAPIQPPAPKMVFVHGGTFQMGVENGFGDDTIHTVTLRDYFIGQYEITFEEYDLFCDATGRDKPEDKEWGRGQRPVILVSWFDAVAYCNWLSRAFGLKEAYTISGTNVRFNLQSNGYRLPTEAEWEYAANGGPADRKYAFSGSDELNEVAWYRENSGHQTHPVGHLKPNDLNIFDMSGNVREWCFDWHTPYRPTASTNPTGPSIGKNRIFRGGFWGRNAGQMRVVYRNSWSPNFKHYGTGFRLARWK